MLALLLSLQVKTCQPSKVLFAHGFVDGGASSDSFSVIMGCVGPPISFRFHVSKYHVLDRDGQAWHLRELQKEVFQERRY